MTDYTPRHAPASTAGRLLPVAIVGAIAMVAVGAWVLLADRGAGSHADTGAAGSPSPAAEIATATPAPTSTPVPTPTPAPTPTPTPYPGLVDPSSVGKPWGTAVNGLLTFRGNPTRTFYGGGPVPVAPSIQWSYPSGRTMCGPTSLGGEVEHWCGTGWTGQPAIFERGDRTWAVFGAYDHRVHFVDADSGEDILEPFRTGDIIKGSVTIDPDGFPLVYSGSRDGFFHLIAIDRETPSELWRLSADEAPGRLWNDDWDGSALVLDDYLILGGENSLFHVVKLNRAYDESGLATVAPELVFAAPGYDDELLAAVGQNVSIENSVAVFEDTVYFSNSGGLVQGWDLGGVAEGVDPTRTFRYWVGDDVDASVVIDEAGALYVGVEYERGTQRSRDVGQLVKLDPTREDPLVWSVFDNRRFDDGLWATPAIHRDIVIAAADSGRLLGVDRESGEIRWEIGMAEPLWSSPVIVDDVLIEGDCNGDLHAFDVSDTTVEPPKLWSIRLGGCIESTPAVWGGRIIVGTRQGQVHMVGD